MNKYEDLNARFMLFLIISNRKSSYCKDRMMSAMFIYATCLQNRLLFSQNALI